jgi:hypothetical protein
VGLGPVLRIRPEEDSASARREFSALRPSACGCAVHTGQSGLGSTTDAVDGPEAVNPGWAIGQNKANSDESGSVATPVCKRSYERNNGSVRAPKQSQFGGQRPRDCGLRIERRRPGWCPRQTNPISSRRRHPTEEICAKRSQTWDNWGIWAKVVILWGVARPGSETCETNPIWGPETPRLRIGDCGLKETSLDAARVRRS